jgi:hypothetical protein
MFLTLQLISQHKKIHKLNKALLRVIAIRSFLKKHFATLSDSSSSINVAVIGNIQKVAHVMGLRKALRFIDLDFNFYAKIRKNITCPSSIYDLCLLKHPSQLLKKEITIIKSYCADGRFIHWPLIAVYYQIKKDGAAYLNSSIFCKYVKLLRLERVKAMSRRKNHQIDVRALKPLEILHPYATILTL